MPNWRSDHPLDYGWNLDDTSYCEHCGEPYVNEPVTSEDGIWCYYECYLLSLM